MEEQVVIWPGTLNKPIHCADDIFTCGDAHLVPLVVGEDHHIFPCEVVARVHKLGHITDIVDTTAQLIGRAEIIDSN